MESNFKRNLTSDCSNYYQTGVKLAFVSLSLWFPARKRHDCPHVAACLHAASLAAHIAGRAGPVCVQIAAAASAGASADPRRLCLLSITAAVMYSCTAGHSLSDTGQISRDTREDDGRD